MNLAIISDIHGNSHALDRVLDEIARERFDRIVCLGDVVAFGPQPAEVVGRLRALDPPTIMGNCDDFLADWPLPEEDSLMYRQIRWAAERLTPEDITYMRGFSPTVTIPLGDATVLCFHGSPRSNREIILSTTPEDQLSAMLAGTQATVLIGGHTHLQMVRHTISGLVVNAGSVGLPRIASGIEDPFINPAWAEWAAITTNEGRLSVELRRTPLDVPTMLATAEATGMPGVEEWSAGWKRGLEAVG
jgi:putative phosphoesterase